MTEEHRHHHHSRRRSSPLVAFLRAYLVEILIVLGLGLAIFLLFERMNIRATLLGWMAATSGAARSLLTRTVNGVLRFVSQLGLSELLALPLLAVVFVGIVLRTRWRLARTPSLTALQCPVCGGKIHRVHRRTRDHIISWFVPVHRYTCANPDCHWRGLRVVDTTQARRSRSRSP